MEPERVYFTWPDGVFGYDCRGCGDCCKGLGIGLDAAGGQVAALSGRYPDLTPFVRRRGDAWTAFNPRGRCFFLDPEGLCAVELAHGRDAKPASCRLFPFNRVFRLGAYTVVDYNSVICPLRPQPAGDPAVRHADVLAEIASIADAAIVGTALALDRESDAQRLVARERKVAGACFTAARADAPEVDAVWQAQHPSGKLAPAQRRLSRALEAITGQAWRSPSRAGIRTALWLTPSMRFNELFGPRSYDSLSERWAILPELWLGWLHFLAAAEALSVQPIDMRAATSLWGEVMPLAYLAARWHMAPTLEPGPLELPGAADPDRVIERLGSACVGNRKRRSLGQLFGPLLADYGPAERVALARLAEVLLRPIRWRPARAA